MSAFSRLLGTTRVLADIQLEREAQDAKWGEQNHPDGTGRMGDHVAAIHKRNVCEYAAKDGNLTWRHILDEEIAEAYAETDPVLLRTELVQVGAVVAAWIEALDRR